MIKQLPKFITTYENEVVYAIGDVHGMKKELENAINWIKLDKIDSNKIKKIVFLGDVIDRGYDSFGCVKLIEDLKNDFRVITLLGNHEAMMKSIFDTTINEQDRNDFQECWLYNGGTQVVANCLDNKPYSVKITDALLSDYDEYLNNLQNYCVSGNILFIHAGISRKYSLSDNLLIPWNEPLRKLDFNNHWLWMRDINEYQKQESFDGYFIVHGHTPIQNLDSFDKDIDRQLLRHHLNLDFGSFFSNIVNVGKFDKNELTLMFN